MTDSARATRSNSDRSGNILGKVIGMQRFTVRLAADGYRVTGTKRYQPPADEPEAKKLWAANPWRR